MFLMCLMYLMHLMHLMQSLVSLLPLMPGCNFPLDTRPISSVLVSFRPAGNMADMYIFEPV